MLLQESSHILQRLGRNLLVTDDVAWINAAITTHRDASGWDGLILDGAIMNVVDWLKAGCIFHVNTPHNTLELVCMEEQVPAIDGQGYT